MLTIKINMHKHALLLNYPIEKNIFHYTTITDKSMSWFNSCIINLEKNSMPHFVK